MSAHFDPRVSYDCPLNFSPLHASRDLFYTSCSELFYEGVSRAGSAISILAQSQCQKISPSAVKWIGAAIVASTTFFVVSYAMNFFTKK